MKKSTIKDFRLTTRNTGSFENPEVSNQDDLEPERSHDFLNERGSSTDSRVNEKPFQSKYTQVQMQIRISQLGTKEIQEKKNRIVVATQLRADLLDTDVKKARAISMLPTFPAPTTVVPSEKTTGADIHTKAKGFFIVKPSPKK